MKSTTKTAELDILQIQQATMVAVIVGTSPLIYNAVSEKSKRELLLPAGRKNTAARATTLKHDPIVEFFNSTYRSLDDNAPTRLVFPAPAFKQAMAQAALDIPGATKSAVGRLSWITGDKIPVFGIPQLHMAVTRSADINHTPDIRTRAILPRWACALRCNFVRPQLSERNVIHLLAAAGVLCGVGDFRQGKGSGSYGQFRLADDANDPEFQEIVQSGGREAQDAALANPVAYDQETLDLFSWATEEIARRREDSARVDRSAPEGEPEVPDVGALLLAKPKRRGRAAKAVNGAAQA